MKHTKTAENPGHVWHRPKDPIPCAYCNRKRPIAAYPDRTHAKCQDCIIKELVKERDRCSKLLISVTLGGIAVSIAFIIYLLTVLPGML